MTATENPKPTDSTDERKLSKRDRDIFFEMLDADDEPNENLVAAFKARREVIAD